MTLAARSIGFAYRRGTPVLRSVCAEFAPGSVTAVLGPNGAGKSTLLRLLAGLLESGAGHAALDDRPVREIPLAERARRIVHIPQVSRVGFAYTALEVVRMGRYTVRADQTGARSALERVGLGERADEPFHAMSAGQQQRVTLARALAQADLPAPAGTRAILADEPVSAMDPLHADRSLATLAGAARAGAAVVLVLHDLAAALRHADRAVLLDAHGTVAGLGTGVDVIRPERLEPVFGVPFREFSADGRRVAIVPA